MATERRLLRIASKALSWRLLDADAGTVSDDLEPLRQMHPTLTELQLEQAWKKLPRARATSYSRRIWDEGSITIDVAIDPETGRGFGVWYTDLDETRDSTDSRLPMMPEGRDPREVAREWARRIESTVGS